MSDESLPLDDRYKRVRRLGSGAFGEVWLAEAPGGVEVALKVIYRPLDNQQGQRELQALELVKRLRHPFLLQIHAFWTAGDRLCIAMELADGSLRDRLRACRAADLRGIPSAELLTYMQEAAAALDFLHKKHVQHGDIKPENILLVGDHAKVADFGLARPQQSQQLMSADGSGTPLYMSPELWQGKVSPHADQYSLAATYVELRRDQPLFANCTLPELMFSHLGKTPDLAPLGEAERHVLLRALAKDPMQRFPNCLEFVRKLEQALAKDNTHSTPASARAAVAHGRRTTDHKPGVGDSDSFGTLSPHDTPSSGETPPPPPPDLLPAAEESAAPADASDTPTLIIARPPRRLRLGLAAAGLLLAAGIAWFLVHSGGGSQPSFELGKPSVLRVRAGESGKAFLPVRRQHFQGSITVTLTDLPPDVVPSKGTIPADAEEGEVRLVALPDAPPGRYEATLVATAGDLRRREKLPIQIEKRDYFLPPGWEKADPAWREIDGQIYYDRINVVRDGTPVPFRFIPRDRLQKIDSFYIMETKVWAGLFRRFAAWAAAAGPPPLHNWDWREEPLNRKEDNPILGVTAEDAGPFIQWLTEAGEKGHLPSEQQWDKAAGRFEPNPPPGPFVGPPEGVKTVNRTEPLEIKEPEATASHDVSPWGVRFLAGNGLEFTDTLWWRSLDRVPFHLQKNPDRTDQLFLRGASFDQKAPFQFQDLKDPGFKKGLLPFNWDQPGLGPQSYISFRAVFEP